ncbi:winged helix DNA-binding domain-containing protein [Actinocrispum wychmicini]|uniref:Winged helix DNA-binding protein n=1 Tax=Actinocrispum wychmicini TaxID=1213861 RepID=A0A4R2IR22_9PSEU|nr:winged helix DNA-binding domain-containing protein [Actinocrispum wychmicini]TCO46529.1 winged helix DNA-binding protein [Actinocrispum wychmicini]
MTVLARRMHAQGLGGHATDVLTAVAAAAGLQAQDTAACRLSVRPRTSGLTAEDVTKACADGTVVRTWLMRGTLHMVAAKDVHWMVSFFGPSLVRGQRRRRAELGLTDDICARALPALQDILPGNALSRSSIVEQLNRRGIEVDPKGQAPAHMMFYAATHGLICRGPELARDEPSYVLLDEWVTDRFTPDDPLQELGRRYHQAFGPASAEDFAFWAGIPLGQARKVEPTDSDTVQHGLRLLPAFDTYVLGYKNRPVAEEFAKRVNAGGGMIRPTIVVDGRIAGTWRRRSGDIEIEPFEQLDRTALEVEVADLSRFVGGDLHLVS